ncbi:hypothetical protein SAMN04487886_10669 [Clostridium sp. DSM 8431]|uniref:hypothetical protein n=1 Tax=Clostridium sp. DSM 8431 TaxID=1761781 RepID=UPI0008DF5F02|nr:hypothetical protein [Clostridium sp. DSM 8431]SFU58605.1 hypothetical protein SAMN04487886_10669 [Clostridium sp. DSM 8431]
MNTYSISFFVSDTGSCSCGYEHNHESHSHIDDIALKIEAKIKSFGAWAQVLPETFTVKSELTAKEMYDEIKSICNNNDLIFINKIDCSDIAYNNPDFISWIEK